MKHQRKKEKHSGNVNIVEGGGSVAAAVSQPRYYLYYYIFFTVVIGETITCHFLIKKLIWMLPKRSSNPLGYRILFSFVLCVVFYCSLLS